MNEKSPVSTLVHQNVYTVPAYNDISIAAKVMRKHKIHHVIVTHEKEVVGIISAFDLLKLMDDHKFTMKNPPTPKNKKKL